MMVKYFAKIICDGHMSTEIYLLVVQIMRQTEPVMTAMIELEKLDLYHRTRLCVSNCY